MAVFVTQEVQTLNYAPAESYGDVVFLTNRDFSAMKQSINNKALMADIKQGLIPFDPAVDFVAPSGSPVVTAAVMMVLAARGFKEITLLRWSNRDAIYQPICLSLL